MKNKKYFPMFIDLTDKSVVIVGGGSTAVRRARTLLQFTRNVKVGSVIFHEVQFRGRNDRLHARHFA